ncbi:MAG: hypothetical protein Q7S65_01700 [Nanoarchaeota archaeon]|nr:hypothetical protein [Nanoarchaeota archaeon]
MVSENTIMDRLDRIERAVGEVRKQLADSSMSEEDYASLLNYREEKKAGKLVSHKDLKKELGF